jgi:hypothetical protein
MFSDFADKVGSGNRTRTEENEVNGAEKGMSLEKMNVLPRRRY